MIYTTYLDKSIYTESDCDWKDLPLMPIVSIGYRLPNNKTFTMQGFESYLCIKEIYSIVMGGHGKLLDTVNLFGKIGNSVYQFSFNVRKNKALQRKGVWNKDEFAPMIWKPLKQKFELDRVQKTNHALWKRGLKGTPIARIIK